MSTSYLDRFITDIGGSLTLVSDLYDDTSFRSPTSLANTKKTGATPPPLLSTNSHVRGEGETFTSSSDGILRQSLPANQSDNISFLLQLTTF